MKKNLLQPETKEEILSRINKLTKSTHRQWGKMNVNQMLFHTAAAIQISYGEIKPEPNSNWVKRQLLRSFILKTDFPTPKEKVKTFPETDAVALSIDPSDFDAERNKLLELVKKFPSKPLDPISPLLGKMTSGNWARLLYTHFDHHLKQFGV